MSAKGRPETGVASAKSSFGGGTTASTVAPSHAVVRASFAASPEYAATTRQVPALVGENDA